MFQAIKCEENSQRFKIFVNDNNESVLTYEVYSKDKPSKYKFKNLLPNYEYEFVACKIGTVILYPDSGYYLGFEINTIKEFILDCVEKQVDAPVLVILKTKATNQ